MRLLCLAIICAIAIPAYGDPTLLVEFGLQDNTPSIYPAGYTFVLEDPQITPSDSSYAWITTVVPEYTGNEITTFADDATIAEFNRVLADTDHADRTMRFVVGENAPYGPTSFDIAWFPVQLPFGIYGTSGHYKAHVPQRGHGLFGYRITGIEQAVNPAGFTIYFYGEAVPEPTSGLLVLIGLCAVVLRRIR